MIGIGSAYIGIFGILLLAGIVIVSPIIADGMFRMDSTPGRWGMRTVGLILGLFAVGAILAALAAPHSSETKTTTYTTKAGGFEYDYAFGPKQFLFEAFDGDVISTVACHPSRTSFVDGDPAAPTLTVTTSREAYPGTLLFSVPSEVLDCEVAGLGDFADNYWTER